MEQDNAQQVIDGIGVMSELTALFYKNLIKNGVPPYHAYALASDYMCTVILGNGGNDNE